MAVGLDLLTVRRRYWGVVAFALAVSLGACGSGGPAQPVIAITTAPSTSAPTSTVAITTTVAPATTVAPVTTTTAPMPATTAVTSILSNPATLSNPDPGVGGLACTLRYMNRPQGAHCYWNGLVWVPS